MTQKRNWTFALLAVALTVSLSTSGLVLGKGKPPKDPPEPDPPPVSYALYRFSMPTDYTDGNVDIYDINEASELVGRYRDYSAEHSEAFHVDFSTGNPVLTNLNDLPLDPDPNLSDQLPTGWAFAQARGINNTGEITGSIVDVTNSDLTRGFVLKLRPDPADLSALPQLYLIPEDPAWAGPFGIQINEDGLVLGTAYYENKFYLYRPGDTEVQVILNSYDFASVPHLTSPVNGDSAFARVVLGDEILNYEVDTGTISFTSAPYDSVRGFNDVGDFCGTYSTPKRKGKTTQKGYVDDGAFHSLDDMSSANALNNDRDVIGRRPEGNNALDLRTFLDHGAQGSISIDTTIVAEDEADQAIWDDSVPNVSVLSERDATGFPVLAGTVSLIYYGGSHDGFVLIPIP